MIVKEYFRGISELDEIHLYNYQLKETAADAQSTASEGIPAHPSEAI